MITDEGFDVDRQQRLQPLAKLTSEVSEWTLKVKALAKRVSDAGGDLDSATLETVAKEAFQSGKSIRQLCTEQGILPEATLRAALEPMSMTEPQE